MFHQSIFYEPFTAAIFCGVSKPKNLSAFLKDFITQLNEIQQEGILINNKQFRVRIKFFVCDTPARSFLKCCVGHTAADGCERCDIVGQTVDCTRTFNSTSGNKRTDADFRSFSNPSYHTGVSPLTLIYPPIDMINQFILDLMHLIYLGVQKRLLEYWLDRSSTKIFMLMKNELARRSAMIRPDIPLEYPRKMRSTNDVSNFKATEYKFFLKVCGPIILKGILSKSRRDHFLLLHYGCRLLCETNAPQHVNEAREYFHKFVENCASL